jgi:replicative DNA helicase
MPPAIVVFDMIDNIRFDGEMINGGQRTDQMLEAMYQWGRDMAVRYDCPIIATSQISAEGDGLAFPTLAMLKDSKTGKQGAADAIITLGAKNEQAYEHIRFIGLTKNKLALEGRPKSPHSELVLDGPAGRYLEAV